MMKLVFCDDVTCKHNEGGMVCSREKLSICLTESSEMENGKHIFYSVCKDYEEGGNEVVN